MIKNYIREAIAIQQEEGEASNKALRKFQQAINSYDGDENKEYDFLYAHYQAMWISSHLRESENAFDYAKKCMELLDSTIRSGAIFHYTELGKFYEEVIRYATNVIAWRIYVSTDTFSELEKALEIISQGCCYVESPDYYYVLDTKVRILLKLGRKEEAFHIVYDCLRQAPAFADFADIKKDNEYREWKNNFESGKFEYSEQEITLLEKAARITARLKMQNSENVETDEKVNSPMPEQEMVLIKNIKEKYNLPDGYYEDHDCLLLYKGNMHIKEDLDETWYEKQLENLHWENELYGIVIDGDLIVDGNVIFDQPVMLVTKDLRCDYLYSGDGHTLIAGDAHIKYGIYGEGNDGSFDVQGKLITPYILANDHCMPRQSNDNESIYIEGGNYTEVERTYVGESYGSGWGWEWNYFEDATRLLTNEVWMEDDGEITFSAYNFFDAVKRGVNPFHEVK